MVFSPRGGLAGHLAPTPEVEENPSVVYDLKIRGGVVYDGTGAPGRHADIAIEAGRIVAFGDCPDFAHETLDASGAIVTPGFIDLHTHYDGQATWDQDMLPSAAHGVTTAVMGNCGVGFAPVHDRDHARLIRLMEGVEDIPGSALAEGIRFNWRSFPEYLDALDAMPRTIDVAAQLPHDALRLHVMGDRAEEQQAATHEDIAAMRDLCREALEAGALGFSTGRTDNHRTADGKWTPSSEAATAELAGIASALDGLSHGVLQAVSDFDMLRDPTRFDAEFDVLEAMARAARGRPLSISLLEREQAPTQWRSILERATNATAGRTPIHVQVAPRPIGLLLGFEATFHPFMGFPTYKAMSREPLPMRIAKLKDPQTRARLLNEKSEPMAGDGSPVPPLADLLLAHLPLLSRRLFRLGDRPSYEPDPATSVFHEAETRRISPLEAMLDILLEDGGTALLYFPLFNYLAGNLDHVREMLEHPQALFGLGDGGAHVGTICDASFSTTLLAHWTRDRAKPSHMTIERAVHMMTKAQANYAGFHDRGVIAPGAKADINIIDWSNLSLGKPKLVRDLPAGGQRFLQPVRGYRATIVSGRVTLRDDALTGERPGRLIRAGS